VAAPERLYVVKKDMERNTVTLGPEAALYSRELYADELNWISRPGLDRTLRCRAKTRYRQEEQWAVVHPAEGGRVRVVFDGPQRAITPGQAVVFYDGDIVLGGGTIREAEKT
jgi:tRNA-specific 2-thiouridylase